MGDRVRVGVGSTKRGASRRLVTCCAAVLVAIPLAASATPPPAGTAPTPPTATSAGPSALLDRARQGRVVPPALEDVEQVCALLTSCPDLPIPASMVPTDFASCVKSISSQLASPGGVAFSLLVRECGLRANSCSELRTCGLRGANATACAGRGRDNPAGYCDIDGRALSCFHERIAGVRDCPRGGEQCSVREGQAACSLGACPPEIAEGGAPVCSASGTRIVMCEHGVLNSLDCAAFGLICATNGPAGSRCAPPTAPCIGTSTRCEGDVSVSCYNGHEVSVECGAAGMTCAPSAAPGATPDGRTVGSCVAAAPAGAACDPNAPPRCEGATLRYCSAGQPRSFLCKTLGFNRCATTASGARCL